MSLFQRSIFGRTVLHLQAFSIRSMEDYSGPQVFDELRFTEFYTTNGEHNSTKTSMPFCFYLGQLPVLQSVSLIALEVFSHVQNHPDARELQLCEEKPFQFASGATTTQGPTMESALELLVDIGFLCDDRWTPENVHKINQLMQDMPLEEEEYDDDLADATLEYDLVEIGDSIEEMGFEDMLTSSPSIEGLERVSYIKREGFDEERVICLVEFNTEVEVSWMPCSHLFHSRCIAEWLGRSHHCPLCRCPYEEP
ncbi:putative E3 ubiquitin-protein ligase RING1-like [Cocos nucifera]|uniref:Putative E3 ubiquitin-protein ligase RING1-like n=1 Tax=Cocos nucifera TaxID=13894 RepID=A0A8K0HVT4_COCNU|nr:putative E3 ubiquitin-protein ligase RING1-like [Cocos nucifera]